MTAALQPATDEMRPASRPIERSKLHLIDAAWVCHLLPQFTHLTPADKAILCGLVRHLGQHTLDAGSLVVWPSAACLAIATGYTERQVTRSISRLETCGLIRRSPSRRRRTFDTDLTGFSAIAADALRAHRAVKRQVLPDVGRHARIHLVDPDRMSATPDNLSGLTETDNEPENSVEQNDAARGQFRRRPGKPAADDGATAPSPSDASGRKAVNCSSSRAGFSAGADSEPSIPAERVLAAFTAAWEGLPTLRRLVDLDQLRTAPLDVLASIVKRDYLATVTGLRNPQHIWSWAVNRHGVGNAVLGWIIACDTPRSADRPDRNPAGWFTRFATSEKRWDLSRNLRQLTRVAEPAPSSAMPTDMAEGLGRVDWPPELDFESAATLLSAYRTAW
ncbi:MAG: helix-turn-helix domain-containing protein, partial [Inquilinus sp.]|uniref:helix-turn-helix domain-containing protein n=1 Tax=Inquilinus sp. TaxID=1932117 RepID=UPI003F3101FF